jgi:hypothetical protein
MFVERDCGEIRNGVVQRKILINPEASKIVSHNLIASLCNKDYKQGT